MKFFQTIYDSTIDGPVEGDHSHSLPMVECPTCGNGRGSPAVCYPGFDPRILGKQWESRMRTGRYQEFTWDEFERLRNEIRERLGDTPLPPAANFGPFKGKFFKRSRFTDFVMPNHVNLLAKASVVSELRARGHDLQTFDIVLQGTSPEKLVEIWAPPVGRLHADCGAKWCERCDRAILGNQDILKIGPEIENRSVFVMADRKWIVVSERFFHDVRVTGFSGLEFEPIEAR